MCVCVAGRANPRYYVVYGVRAAARGGAWGRRGFNCLGGTGAWDASARTLRWGRGCKGKARVGVWRVVGPSRMDGGGGVEEPSCRGGRGGWWGPRLRRRVSCGRGDESLCVLPIITRHGATSTPYCAIIIYYSQRFMVGGLVGEGWHRGWQDAGVAS